VEGRKRKYKRNNNFLGAGLKGPYLGDRDATKNITSPLHGEARAQ
jgi:hypothetical protein